jgi:hypothetical protein
MRPNQLYLHEEILLLALRDKEGTIPMETQYGLALGGALLAELLLHERIKVEESRRKKLVVVAPRAKPIGEPLLDECFEKIKTAKRRATLQTWVGRLSRVKQLKHRVAMGLCDRRILKADEGKVLLIFKRKIYPEIDPGPEREVIARLRQAVFTYTREIDSRTIVLVALVHTSGILKLVFDKKKLKGRKKRLEQITKGDLVGTATREAIQAVQAAVIVATMVPAIAATTAAR